MFQVPPLWTGGPPNGGGFGFSSQAWWHPDSQLAMVLLTNSEPDTTSAIAEAPSYLHPGMMGGVTAHCRGARLTSVAVAEARSPLEWL